MEVIFGFQYMMKIMEISLMGPPNNTSNFQVVAYKESKKKDINTIFIIYK